MRLFVSIDFPESILKEIHSWIPEQKGWKKAPIHQMHLTLVFLGDCSEEEKNEIHRKLSEIEFTPFEMTISGLGAFPNESAPRIIWARVRQNDSLIDLQARISDRLKDHIKSKNSNPYIPHITIVRKKSRKGMNHNIKQNLQRETPAINVRVKEFHLKKSILKSSGSKHETLNIYKCNPV